MGKLEAIIFDCFGVIYVDVSEAYFAHFPDKHDELRNVNLASDRGLISQQEYMGSIGKITGDPPEVVAKAMLTGHTANKALVDYIQRELKPHYKLGMLSNIGRDWIQSFFTEHELHDLFDAAVLSSEEGIMKPEPEIYRRTAEKLNVTPENCLMIDDRKENCRGAEAAGMQSLHYESFAQLKHDLPALLQ